MGGVIGTCLVGVFSQSYLGGFSDGSMGYGIFHQVSIQLIGIISVTVWSVILTYLIFKALDYLIGFRVSPEEEELAGLDKTFHGESGYNF